MTQKTSILTFTLILFIGLLGSCKKENNGNETPSTPDTPIVEHQIPPIDEYMPERLLHICDSLNVLYRGVEPPTINGSFMAESMNIVILDKVPESNYYGSIGTIPVPSYYEFDKQNEGQYHLTFKQPMGTPGEYNFYLERSDTDSTYSHIKDNTSLFTDDPIAPPYFKSSTFIPEDFKHAYIIGHGDYFTIYFYEIRELSSNSLPLSAILISGKTATDENGNPIIEDFWCGKETMKYYNESIIIDQLLQIGYLPTPGDIYILQCPVNLVEGSYND